MRIAIPRILVPTDFSPCAEAAARWAIDIARPDRPNVTLLHVYQAPTYFFADAMAFPVELVADLRRRAQASLERARADLAQLGADVTVRLEEGIPATVITRLAAEESSDLIVMGTHGHTGLTRALLGSVAERVLRTAPCPVLVVPLRT